MSKPQLAAYFQRLHDSFPFFYAELSKFVGLKKPCRARLDMAQWMQDGPPEQTSGKRYGVLACRKVGKTFIACAFDCWKFYRNNMEQVFHCSASTSFAQDSLALERKWLGIVPFLKHMAPGGRDRERDNLSRFDIATANLALLHSASSMAFGIMGQLPGKGATLVRPDDIETPENTLTQDGRRLLENRIEGLECLTLPGADILYLGTPQCEESIYRKLLERGYVFRAWPIAYPQPGEEIPGLAPMLVEDLASGRAKPGDPVFPDVLDAEQVMLKRQRTSPATFAMQFMLRTDLLEKEVRPLRLDDLIVFKEMHRDVAPSLIVWGHTHQNGSTRLPISSVGFGDDGFYAPVLVADGAQWRNYHGTKAALDPAGRGKDEMAWAIAGQLYGNIFLKHVNGVHGGATPENLDIIVSSLRDHGARELIVETNLGGDNLVYLLEPVIRRYTVKPGDDQRYPEGWSCTIVPDHVAGQKELRIISALSPVTQQHRLIVSESVAKDRTWALQLTRLTKERGSLDEYHDDRIEATSMVVKAFGELLYQDAERITQKRREEQQKETLRRINARFAPVKPPNWINR